MRFGWRSSGDIAADATRAEELGYDLVWLDEAAGASVTALAASLAATTTGLRIGVTAEIGEVHPIELAEEVAVADLALGGRLVLAVRAGDEEPRVAACAEAVDLLIESLSSHPFRHAGPIWPSPADLPQNTFARHDRVRVTPPPAQLELPVWVEGRALRDIAAERMLGVVATPEEDLADLAAWWDDLRGPRPWARGRVRRAVRWVPPRTGGRLDVDASVRELRALQHAFDLDVVIVCPPAQVTERLMADISTEVRPRVQLEQLPPGLEDHWTTDGTEVDHRRQAAAESPTVEHQEGGHDG